MTDKVTIHIAQPANVSGRWRVKVDGTPEKEVASQEEAIRCATDHARLVIEAGRKVVMKIQRPDGAWEVFRF